MKKLISLSLLGLLGLLSACPNPNNGGGGGQPAYATTPSACNVLGGSPNSNGMPNQYANPYGGYNGYSGYNGYNPYNPYAGYGNTNMPTTNMNQYYCQNSIYNGNVGNYSYGQWYWPQVWQPGQANCGCPVGYMSVYAASYGVACAPVTYMNAYNVSYMNTGWNYGFQAQQTPGLNIPQAQYTGSSINGCNQTAQGCDTRLNNCSSGLYCQAVGGGSTIGLCVQGY